MILYINICNKNIFYAHARESLIISWPWVQKGSGLYCALSWFLSLTQELIWQMRKVCRTHDSEKNKYVHLDKNIYFFDFFCSLKRNQGECRNRIFIMIWKKKKKKKTPENYSSLTWNLVSILKSFSFFQRESLAIGYWIQFCSSYESTISIYVDL